MSNYCSMFRGRLLRVAYVRYYHTGVWMFTCLDYLGDCVVELATQRFVQAPDVSLVKFHLEALLKPCVTSLWKRSCIKCRIFHCFLRSKDELRHPGCGETWSHVSCFWHYWLSAMQEVDWVITIHCWPKTDTQKSPSRLSWLPRLFRVTTPLNKVGEGEEADLNYWAKLAALIIFVVLSCFWEWWQSHLELVFPFFQVPYIASRTTSSSSSWSKYSPQPARMEEFALLISLSSSSCLLIVVSYPLLSSSYIHRYLK